MITIAAAALLLGAVSWGDPERMSWFYMAISVLMDDMSIISKSAILLLFILVFVTLFMALRRMERAANNIIEEKSAKLLTSEKIIEEKSNELRASKEKLDEHDAITGVDIMELEKIHRQSRDLLDCVNVILSRHVSEISTESLFSSLLVDIMQLSASKYGFIGETIDDENGLPVLKMLSAFDTAKSNNTQRLDDLSPIGLASYASNETPIIANDMKAHEHIDGIPEDHPPLRSYLGIPLIQGQHIIGFIGLFNRDNGYNIELVENIHPVLLAAASVVNSNRAWNSIKHASQSTAHKDSILKSTHDGIITFDVKGHVTEFNLAAETMFGVKAKDALGKNISDFVVLPVLIDSYRNEMQQYLDNEESRNMAKRVKLPAMRTDGQTFPVELTVAPFECGVNRFFDAFFHDLSKRKKVEDEAQKKVKDVGVVAQEEVDQVRKQMVNITRELQKHKKQENDALAAEERFERDDRTRFAQLADISHELRMPLDAVISFSEDVLNGNFGEIENPQQREYIKYVHDCGAKLLEHIGEVLNLSGDGAGKVEVDPDDTTALINYAKFSTHIRHNQDMAEALFQRAIETEPDNPAILSNYSLFRTSIRNDHERADKRYLHAVESNPENALCLGNYAVFLADDRKHYERAEEFYKRAMNVDPHNARNLANYARFQARILSHNERAVALYKNALEVEPDNADILIDYALFLRDSQLGDDQSEALYKHAVEANPDAYLPQQAYAMFILYRGNIKNGLDMLEAVMAKLSGEDLMQALFFQYAYTRSTSTGTKALAEINAMLEDRIRSPLFNTSMDVRHLLGNDHPEKEFLETLARVIAVCEDIKALEQFPMWTNATKK